MLSSFFSSSTSSDSKCSNVDIPPVTFEDLPPLLEDIEPPSDEEEDIKQTVGVIHDIIRLEEALEAIFLKVPAGQLGPKLKPLFQELFQAADEFFRWGEQFSDDEQSQKENIPPPDVPVPSPVIPSMLDQRLAALATRPVVPSNPVITSNPVTTPAPVIPPTQSRIIIQEGRNRRPPSKPKSNPLSLIQ